MIFKKWILALALVNLSAIALAQRPVNDGHAEATRPVNDGYRPVVEGTRPVNDGHRPVNEG